MLKKNLERHNRIASPKKGQIKDSGNSQAIIFILAMTWLLLGSGFAYSQTDGVELDLRTAEKAIRMRQYGKAASLYRKAAAGGDAEAQYQLANLYLLGRGVSQSDQQALTWLEKASAQSHAAAQYTLGLKIVSEKPERALQLIQSAAAQKYNPAKVYMERLGNRPQLATNKDDESSLWFGAAGNNQIEVLQTIFNKTKSIDLQDEAGRTALFSAVESNSFEAAAWLLKNKANPNHADKFGNTPLFLAVTNDQQKMLRQLIDQGGKLTQILPNGDNLLLHAIRLKHDSIATFLIKQKINTQFKNKEGWTALDLAEYLKRNQIVSQLKARGALHGDGWVKNNETDGVTLTAKQLAEVTSEDLAKIVVSGNVDLFSQLANRKPELINQPLADRSSLLSLAIKNGDDKMAAALIQSHANVRAVGHGGFTPLHVAARKGELIIIKQLLDAGADPLQVADDEYDAVAIAIQAGQTEAALSLFEYLKQKKVKAPFDDYLVLSAQYNSLILARALLPSVRRTAADQFGRTAMWFAAKSKNIELIALLLKKGIPPQSPDQQGRNAFFIAIDSNCLACAQAMKSKVDINEQTESGSTPLMAASRNGNAEIVRWLLKVEADKELRNEQGSTALINAVEADAIEVVGILVTAGANTSRKNKLGFSALDIAENKSPEMISALKGKSVFGLF